MRGWWLAVGAAAAIAGLAPLRVCGEDPPPPVPPEIVARYTEVLKKVMLAERPRLDKRMSDEIAEVAKATGLQSDGVKTLEAAAGKAEDAAQAELTAKWLEVVLPKMGAQGFEAMEKTWTSESMASSGSDSDFRSAYGLHSTAAKDQPAWTEALARTLSPEQAAAWEKSQAERKAAAAKEIGQFVAAQADGYREMITLPIRGEADEIIALLHLPKERAEGITAASKQAVEASLDAWRKGAEQSLLAEDDATLKNILKRRWYGFSFDVKDAPSKQAVWTDALAKGLTDDERARLQTARDEQHARHTDTLAQLLVMTLDENVAFTASQRARLKPVAQRLVQADPAFSPVPSGGNYGNLTAKNFYNAATAVRPEELDPILDEIQRKHWQEVTHRKYTTNEYGQEVPADLNPDPPSPDAKVGEEPEDMERMLSDYLRTRAAARERECDARMTLQVEDATRIAGLAEPAAVHLRIAAHGAAQADTMTWMSSIEQTVRAQTQGATPEALPQRLSNASRYYYQRSEPNGGPLWTTAVGAEMTEAQQTAWRAECDERDRYRDAAIAQFLVAEFDRRFTLTAEQRNQLVPVLTQAVQDYKSDIERMFSYGGSPWYLMTYYLFLPFNAVPENDLKALLSPEQWKAWTGSEEGSYTASYWPNIKSNHANRTQQQTKR